jgi:hypothetical protein
MAIRHWIRSGNYTNKHTGIYQNTKGGYSESTKFNLGKRVDVDHQLRFVFEDSRLHELAGLGCLWTNINPPIVNGAIGTVLLEYAEQDVQLFTCQIIAIDGRTHEYSLVNVVSLVECLDYHRSVISRSFDDGSPQGFSELRFKSDECMSKHNLARLAEYEPYILVSERLYEALSKLKYKGLHFEFDSDSDSYRF